MIIQIYNYCKNDNDNSHETLIKDHSRQGAHHV